MTDRYPFTPVPLGFSYSALEPWIDAKTVEVHYTKHYQGYIDKLNGILKKRPELQSKSLKELLCVAERLPCPLKTDILHNAGGVYNHAFYFSMLTPECKAPDGALICEIERRFGSLGALREEMVEAAGELFGSGYVWLLTDSCGRLSICCIANQDTNIPTGKQKLLAIDVWEHAYYLKYLNRRNEYAGNIFHILNWRKAEALYNEARQCRN